MAARRPKALMSWSSGKDSAWSLHCIQQAGEYEVVGLLTSINKGAQRVAMHGVRQGILQQQADAAGLELHVVELPSHSSNDAYEQLMADTLNQLKTKLDLTHIIFGDLFLADIRAYREKQMEALGLNCVFPLWGHNTTDLAHKMLAGGLQASITCVDKHQMNEGFSGRKFDRRFLQDLPDNVDPCGENGEFHTLVTDGPMFKNNIKVYRGPIKAGPRFVFSDFKISK